MNKLCPKTILLIAIATAIPSLQAETLPFYPQSASVVNDKDKNENGFSRLKISLTSNETDGDGNILVGNVTACSNKECYRPSESVTNIALNNTTGGKSVTIAQFKIPQTSIKSIHFEGVAGNKTVAGDIDIIKPLEFDLEYFGEDVLIVLSKQQNGVFTVYKPQIATAFPYHPSRETVYYNPKFSTTINLSLGTTLFLPEGATSEPKVFSIGIHDTGNRYPLVDIQPEVILTRPAELSLTELKSKAQASSSNTASGQTSSPTKLSKTGLIKITSSIPSQPSESAAENSYAAQAVTTAATTDSCTAFIVNNQQQISSALATTGTVYLKGCESVPPYVHITVSNMLDSRELGGLFYNFANGNGAPLSLQTVVEQQTFATRIQVAVNGFYWTGDLGNAANQVGFANGFVQNRTTVLANNFTGGGVQQYGTSDGNKVAILQGYTTTAKWAEGSTAPIFPPDPAIANGFIVGSSTSIVKNGACSSDTKVDRWSAVGSTTGGRLIFVSSTSGSTTTAAELCPVYQALGSNYAMRLDGSSAAAMVLDGTLLNPLTGSSSLVFGSARHVAYAISVFPSNGTSAGLAPVIDNRVTIPPNPCKVTPRNCL